MPRRRKDSSEEQQRIQFAFNAHRHKPIGKVFEYLLLNEQIPNRIGKQKGLDAIAAFWLPYAYQTELGEDNLKAMAQESVTALTKQINQICQTFGIENPQMTQAGPVLKQVIQETVAEVMQHLVVTGASAGQVQGASSRVGQATAELASSRAEPEAGIDFDDEMMFGEMDDAL
ncbi:MAG: hypothetical protein F6J97_22530 [Leptolyngbya sp. SIO4C1]|nr:hypothetical protein [Leptolyngbya sp. SIO4C1]